MQPDEPYYARYEREWRARRKIEDGQPSFRTDSANAWDRVRTTFDEMDVHDGDSIARHERANKAVELHENGLANAYGSAVAMQARMVAESHTHAINSAMKTWDGDRIGLALKIVSLYFTRRGHVVSNPRVVARQLAEIAEAEAKFTDTAKIVGAYAEMVSFHASAESGILVGEDPWFKAILQADRTVRQAILFVLHRAIAALRDSTDDVKYKQRFQALYDAYTPGTPITETKRDAVCKMVGNDLLQAFNYQSPLEEAMKGRSQVQLENVARDVVSMKRQAPEGWPFFWAPRDPHVALYKAVPMGPPPPRAPPVQPAPVAEPAHATRSITRAREDRERELQKRPDPWVQPDTQATPMEVVDLVQEKMAANDIRRKIAELEAEKDTEKHRALARKLVRQLVEENDPEFAAVARDAKISEIQVALVEASRIYGLMREVGRSEQTPDNQEQYQFLAASLIAFTLAFAADSDQFPDLEHDMVAFLNVLGGRSAGSLTKMAETLGAKMAIPAGPFEVRIRGEKFKHRIRYDSDHCTYFTDLHAEPEPAPIRVHGGGALATLADAAASARVDPEWLKRIRAEAWQEREEELRRNPLPVPPVPQPQPSPPAPQPEPPLPEPKPQPKFHPWRQRVVLPPSQPDQGFS
jgi:hypothetical protein